MGGSKLLVSSPNQSYVGRRRSRGHMIHTASGGAVGADTKFLDEAAKNGKFKHIQKEKKTS